jgi:hypothetical protein
MSKSFLSLPGLGLPQALEQKTGIRNFACKNPVRSMVITGFALTDTPKQQDFGSLLPLKWLIPVFCSVTGHGPISTLLVSSMPTRYSDLRHGRSERCDPTELHSSRISPKPPDIFTICTAPTVTSTRPHPRNSSVTPSAALSAKQSA